MKIIQSDEPIIARAMFNTIVLGKRFSALSGSQQSAAIAHEAAHCMFHHTEWRILCLIFAPFLFFWLCRSQEYAADRYAASLGHGRALIGLLSSDYGGGWFQPSHADRRKALKRHDHQFRVVPVKDFSPGSA